MSGAAISGAKWATASRLGSYGLQFAVGLVLARLLTPDDFGLLASIYILTSFSIIFFEMGLGAALVHLQRPSERDKATVFWIDAVGGVVYAVLMLAAAPFVASFFDAPLLEALMPLVALSFTLSVSAVPAAMLQKQLKFRRIAVVELTATGIGHITTLVAAVLGAGPFSLVLGPLVQSTLTTVFYLIAAPWRPRHLIDLQSLRRLWRFSGGLLGYNAVNYWTQNADSLIIGRVLGTTTLSFYSRAYNLMMLPVWQLTTALQRVMFPALAAMQGDHGRLRRAYLNALGVVVFVTTPFLVGIAATADALVPVLWGGQWDPVVPLLQLLCVAGIPQCASTSAGWLFQATGRTGTMFKVSLSVGVVAVAAMTVAVQWGAGAIAAVVLAWGWLGAPVNLFVAGRVVGLQLRDVGRRVQWTMLSSFVMGVVVWLSPVALGLMRTSAVALAAQVVVGVVVYLGLTLLLERDSLVTLRMLARRRSNP